MSQVACRLIVASRARPADAADSFAAASENHRYPTCAGLWHDDWRRPEQPQRRPQRHDVLMEKLPEVPVRLENSRPLRTSLPFLELNDGALDEGTQNQNRKNRGDAKQDVPRRHGRGSPIGGGALVRATNWRPRIICRRRPLMQTSPAVRRRVQESSAPRAVIWRTPSPILYEPKLRMSAGDVNRLCEPERLKARSGSSSLNQTTFVKFMRVFLDVSPSWADSRLQRRSKLQT
jgi:hypothetical protein